MSNISTYHKQVLVITHTYWPRINGAVTSINEVLAALGRRGYKALIYTTRLPEAPLQRERHQEHLVFRSDLLRGYYGTGVLDSAGLLNELGELAGLSRPRFIITNDIYSAFLGAVLSDMLRVQFFMFFHETPMLPAKVIGRHRCHPVFELAFAHIVFRDLRYAKCFAVSRFFFEWARQLGAQEPRLELRYIGVDRSRFSPVVPRKRERLREQFGLTGSVLTCVARIVPRKRIEDILRAGAVLASKHNDLQIVLTWRTEESDSDYVAMIEALIADLEIGRIVRRLPLSDDLLPSLYHCSDVCILASSAEGLGLSILEAMACGVPVVATRTTGVIEVVSEGETGLLVNVGNPDELASAVDNLLSDAATRMRFGRAARLRVETQFDSTANCAQIIDSIEAACT